MILRCHRCHRQMSSFKLSKDILAFECKNNHLICHVKNNDIIYYGALILLLSSKKDYNIVSDIKDNFTVLGDALGNKIVDIPYYIQPVIKNNIPLIEPIFIKLFKLKVFL